MVDAVVTWVDGQDPVHIRQRNSYLEQEIGYSLKDEATDDARFHSVGELWFCIHLIRKNAPWINNIFLVTDNQRPDWLTKAVTEALKVKVVDHRDIFGRHTDYLPTFNSNSIENVLFNIPGVSKRVVYFNDDFFY